MAVISGEMRAMEKLQQLQASKGTGQAGTLTLDFPASRMLGNECLFKPTYLEYFVIAT
jgi:hypothetical protein